MAAVLNQSILDGMLTAFVVNEGVIKLIGTDDGVRSAMCAALFEALRSQGTEVVYFLAPPPSVQALQDGIVEQLQLDANRNFTRTLTHYLTNRDSAYRHLVLIVDRVQDMDQSTLMAVRMLCNIQSRDRELVRVVLSGSPALNARLCQPLYRSLAQHIGQSFTLVAEAHTQPAVLPAPKPPDTASAAPIDTANPDTPIADAQPPSSRRLPLVGLVLGLGVIAVIVWLTWPQALPPQPPALTTRSTPVIEPPLPVETVSVAPTLAEPTVVAPEPPAVDTTLPAALANMLTGWLASWQHRALDDYLGYYATDFTPPQAQSRARWQQQRIHNISNASDIALAYSDLTWTLPTPDRATLRFWLYYRSDGYDDNTLKELTLERQAGGAWRIAREVNLKVDRLR